MKTIFSKLLKLDHLMIARPIVNLWKVEFGKHLWSRDRVSPKSSLNKSLYLPFLSWFHNLPCLGIFLDTSTRGNSALVPYNSEFEKFY